MVVDAWPLNLCGPFNVIHTLTQGIGFFRCNPTHIRETMTQIRVTFYTPRDQVILMTRAADSSRCWAGREVWNQKLGPTPREIEPGI